MMSSKRNANEFLTGQGTLRKSLLLEEKRITDSNVEQLKKGSNELLNRLETFLPQLERANQVLGSTEQSGVEIVPVFDDEQEEEEEEGSGDEKGQEDEKEGSSDSVRQKVEMNISLVPLGNESDEE